MAGGSGWRRRRPLSPSPFRSGVRLLVVMHLDEGGGPPQHVRPWLAALAQEGSLHVVAPGPGRVLDSYQGIASTSSLPYSAVTVPANLAEALRRPFALRRETVAFRRLIRAHDPDLVMVVTSTVPTALLAARREGIPSLVYSAEVFRHASGRRRLGTVLTWMTSRASSAIVACSDTAANEFVGLPRAPVRTIYPGIDSNLFARGDRGRFRRAHGIDEAAVCIAVVGTITRGRGQDIALRALPALAHLEPRVHCIIAGVTVARAPDLRYEHELRELVRTLELDERVTFSGFVPEVENVYAAADVIVNPARVPEGFGRVAVEALAAGRPVVAARTGATPEVLEHGKHALLVDPDDPEAIADAVTRLWTDDALREGLVEAGRKHVLAKFDERRSVEAFLEVVEETLARSAA